jgi:hypothetical protein
MWRILSTKFCMAMHWTLSEHSFGCLMSRSIVSEIGITAPSHCHTGTLLDCGCKGFRVYGPTVWNSLLADVASIDSLPLFPCCSKFFCSANHIRALLDSCTLLYHHGLDAFYNALSHDKLIRNQVKLNNGCYNRDKLWQVGILLPQTWITYFLSPLAAKQEYIYILCILDYEMGLGTNNLKYWD